MKSIRKGISSKIAATIIVVVIIIAAAGWGIYLAAPMTKTVTQSTVASLTFTQTVSSATTTAYNTPAYSNAVFSVGVGTGTPQMQAVYYYGESSGILQKYTPNAKFTLFPPGGAVCTALTSGTLDMLIDAPNDCIPAIQQNAPIKIVANVLLSLDGFDVIVSANSPYHTLQQLEGKTFAIGALAPPAEEAARVAYEACCGFNASNTPVTFSGVGSPTAIIASIETGAAQASAVGSLVALPQLTNGTLRSIYNFTMASPSSVEVLTSSSFIQSNPQAVRALIYGILQTGTNWDNNKTAALQTLSSNFGYTPAAAQYAYGVTVYSIDGAVSISQLQNFVNTDIEYGVLPGNVTASSFVSTEFVPITNMYCPATAIGICG